MKINIRHILIGWGKQWGILPTTLAEHKLSELRLRQCDGCPHAKENKILEVIEGGGTFVRTLYCTLCTCPCKAKSKVVEETCPDNRW